MFILQIRPQSSDQPKPRRAGFCIGGDGRGDAIGAFTNAPLRPHALTVPPNSIGEAAARLGCCGGGNARAPLPGRPQPPAMAVEEVLAGLGPPVALQAALLAAPFPSGGTKAAADAPEVGAEFMLAPRRRRGGKGGMARSMARSDTAYLHGGWWAPWGTAPNLPPRLPLITPPCRSAGRGTQGCELSSRWLLGWLNQ